MKKTVPKYKLAFSLVQLEKGPMQLSGELPAEFLLLTDGELFEVVSNVTYKLDAIFVTGSVVVTGKTFCTISGSCGRCLCDTEQVIEVKRLSLYYDELDKMDELDVTEDVRSEMVLALPVNLLCNKRCAGLCPVCGANLNEEECDCEYEEETPLEEEGDKSSPWGALDDLNLGDS